MHSSSFLLMAIQAYNTEFPLNNNNNNGGFEIRTNPLHQQQQQQEHHHHHQIDQFIRLQNERLRYMLQEQRRVEMEMVVRRMETKALVLMQQKEEEMMKAMKKNMELEDMLRRMETENQFYQKMARESDAMVATLNSTLQQVKERAASATCRGDDVAVEDEESFCCREEEKSGGGSCWNCGSIGETRVLFLPCRHLCCCVKCEEGRVVCPICNTPKKKRIEAFFF